MLISHDHQFLFVHVPKCAGTSIRAAFEPLATNPLDYWENRLLSRVGINLNVLGPFRRRRFRNHSTAAEIRRFLPASVYEKLFKFAFVRNPWERLVSLYHFIPQRLEHRYSYPVAMMSFAEFADVWTRRRDILQKDWVCDSRGRLIVDFVGRMETLEEDFQHVQSRLGGEAKLTLLNSSGTRRDFRELYDNTTRDLVAERLAADIEFFGYQFEPVVNTSEKIRRAA